MKIKQFAVLGIVALAVLFSTNFTLSVNAETFEERIPTYGLYCEDSEIIKSGTVHFDLTDMELLSEGKGVKQSSYQVSATNREVEFVIPFVSSAMDLPPISVTVNGQEVEGSVWYGHNGHWQDYEFDIDKTYSPILDEKIIGTLYTFIPDGDTITVSLKLNEWKSFIYETTNHYSSSYNTEDNSHTWNLKEASLLHEYSFFIFGDPTECSFESSCGYKTETITCKEFIDNQYKKFEEFYDHNGSVPIELFYSVVNRVLQDDTIISYNELFSRSIDTYRVNAYKFRVSLEADAVISYELPIDVHRNYAFKPMIYGVEQYRVGEYPIYYSIELNNDIPYIIESSVSTERNDTVYTVETAEDFSFVFSSAEKPQSISGDNNRIETWRIVLFALSGVFACALIVSVTMLIIYSVKYKKARKGNK